LKILRTLFLATIFLVLAILRLFSPTVAKPKILIFSMTRDQIFEDNSTQAFEDFLAEERFNLTFLPDQVVVECRDIKTIFQKRNRMVTFDIVTKLLVHNVSKSEFISVFKSAISGCWNSRVRRGFSLSWLSDLKKELFDKPFWAQYFSELRVFTTIITTNSSFNKLPQPFLLDVSKENKCHKVMFWYSANIKPIETSSLILAEESQSLHLNSMIDEHLVWNITQKKFLEAKGLHNVKSVGSIVFRPRRSQNNLTKDIDIAYFDVTPFESSNDYYTYQNCSDVLLGVIEARIKLQHSLGIPLNIFVKPKRHYSRLHSKRYIKLLADLSKNGTISIIPSTVNLYKTISNSKFVVGIPFTSPVLIAQEIGVPCVFYAGSSKDTFDIRSTENGIPVLRSVDELTSEFRRNII
jgi:polysaccharide biosynthesis PFTS motif protein